MSNLFPVVILAGGLATRLRPVSETLPKALIDIHGEPFIAHQLKLLRKNNIQKVILCVGHLGEQIVKYVKDGSDFDLKVDYSFDGSNLLGTAGAIQNALPLLPENFFVLYGDSYLPCDFSALQKSFLESNKLALMSIFKNNGNWDASNVEFSNNQIVAYDKIHKTDKMFYIDYGLGVFHYRAFDFIPGKIHYDLAKVYQYLLQNRQLAALEVWQRFYEVGSFKGIDELKKFLDTGCQNGLY